MTTDPANAARYASVVVRAGAVLLALSLSACAGPLTDDGELPDARLAGHWTGEARIIVTWCAQELLPVDLTVHDDGVVTGTIGDAQLVAGRMRRNRGSLARALGVKTDFIVQAELAGPVVAAEGITRAGVNVPLSLTDGVLHGSVHTSGAHVGDAQTMVLTAPFAALVRDAEDFRELTSRIEPRHFGSIHNLHTFDGIYFAGQPGVQDLLAAHTGGLRSVVNLRHAEEQDFDERAHARALDLAYANPAWSRPEELTDELLGRIRAELATAERPLLIHCGSGNRVGAVWLVHRVLDAGLDYDAALAEAQVIGLRTPAYEQAARDFIERHQPSESAEEA